METDVRLAEAARESPTENSLRLYSWSPPAISIGYNQSFEDFDLNKLRHDGIDIVRRPTGGRAILHWHELTYNVVMDATEGGPRKVYYDINEALLRGVKLLGIDAELVESGDDAERMYKSSASIPCFSSSARSEIQYRGKKLIGSAQRRFGRVILQHGSFLLGPEHVRILDYLSPRVTPDAKAEMKSALCSRTTNAAEILGRFVSVGEAIRCVREGFFMAMSFDESDLSLSLNSHL